MNEAEQGLLEFAARQYGVFSRRQAGDHGMSKAQLEGRIRQSRIEIMLPGVYSVVGAPRTGRQRATAACLWLGEDALVSHVTAATLLHLDGCRTIDLHVSVPWEVRRRLSDPPFEIHRVRTLLLQDRATVDQVPCTSATRTLIDCAAVVDDEALEVAFESARRMGLTSPRAFAQRAEALCGRGRPGSTAVRKLLAVSGRGIRRCSTGWR